MSSFYKEEIEEILSKELFPGRGSENVYLRMPINKLNDEVLAYSKKFQDQENDGYQLYYVLKLWQSIAITFDVLNNYICEISFSGNYRGTYQGIGIGSTIRELMKVREDVYFDEQYILVGKSPSDFILRIDNENGTIYNLEDVLDKKIIEITVKDR